MEILVKNDGLLSNLEIVDLLQSRIASRERPPLNSTAVNTGTQFSNSNRLIELQQRSYIEIKFMDYMSNAMSSSDENGKKWGMKEAKDLLREVRNATASMGYKISEEELVQISNLLPKSEVELYLIFNGGNASAGNQPLTDEQLAEVNSIIISHLDRAGILREAEE